MNKVQVDAYFKCKFIKLIQYLLAKLYSKIDNFVLSIKSNCLENGKLNQQQLKLFIAFERFEK